LKALCAGIRGVDPKLVEMILAEVVPQQSTGVRFQDIAGQDKVRTCLYFCLMDPHPDPEGVKKSIISMEKCTVPAR